MKVREKNGEVFLFADLFALKLTRTRQVMIKNKDENLYNLVEGLESPRQMPLDEKVLFLKEIAYGVQRRILESERSEKTPEESLDNTQNQDEDGDYEDE